MTCKSSKDWLAVRRTPSSEIAIGRWRWHLRVAPPAISCMCFREARILCSDGHTFIVMVELRQLFQLLKKEGRQDCTQARNMFSNSDFWPDLYRQIMVYVRYAARMRCEYLKRNSVQNIRWTASMLLCIVWA